MPCARLCAWRRRYWLARLDLVYGSAHRMRGRNGRYGVLVTSRYGLRVLCVTTAEARANRGSARKASEWSEWMRPVRASGDKARPDSSCPWYSDSVWLPVLSKRVWDCCCHVPGQETGRRMSSILWHYHTPLAFILCLSICTEIRQWLYMYLQALAQPMSPSSNPLPPYYLVPLYSSHNFCGWIHDVPPWDVLQKIYLRLYIAAICMHDAFSEERSLACCDWETAYLFLRSNHAVHNSPRLNFVLIFSWGLTVYT